MIAFIGPVVIGIGAVLFKWTFLAVVGTLLLGAIARGVGLKG